MDRRQFLTLSATGLLGLGLTPADAKARKDCDYNIVILGDTHFDTEPASVYHSNYNESVEWLNRVQRAEFARNGEMWRDRCPRLLKRAACLVDDNTRMVFQMGDLIQGDCGSGEVHRKMLDDVISSFKGAFGGLPFVTVVGNHDIRGVDAWEAYHSYMPQRMSSELGKEISKTTFDFTIGDDAFIVIDFNDPDDAEIEKLLAETKGARHTFVITHGPVFPYDSANARWFLHGGKSEEDTAARRHFRKEFARRKAIVLAGHSHRTELLDWHGDGGRITQMVMNSVWSKEEYGKYTIAAQGARSYGELRKSMIHDDGSPVADESALFGEYIPGIRQYIHSLSAGCYKLNVGRKSVSVDFYAGDSTFKSAVFELR